MGKIYETVDAQLAGWLDRQRMFFVATAPRDGGHVNCSPKGSDCFRVLEPRRVAYLDFTGSGIETIAHLKDNGRIVLMFCAFEGPPKIVRLHGKGKIIQRGEVEFEALLSLFGTLDELQLASVRSIVIVDLDRISDSCGYSVPLMHYEGERTQMAAWTKNRLRQRGADALAAYRYEQNLTSIDGLLGLDDSLLPLPDFREESV
jgi:Pyridoxamine 5'-phosphate oxidase